MLWAVVAFVAVWCAGMVCLGDVPHMTSHLETLLYRLFHSDSSLASQHDIVAMHILMAAYFAHLLARTIYLSVRYPRTFGA